MCWQLLSSVSEVLKVFCMRPNSKRLFRIAKCNAKPQAYAMRVLESKSMISYCVSTWQSCWNNHIWISPKTHCRLKALVPAAFSWVVGTTVVECVYAHSQVNIKFWHLIISKGLRSVPRIVMGLRFCILYILPLQLRCPICFIQNVFVSSRSNPNTRPRL